MLVDSKSNNLSYKVGTQIRLFLKLKHNIELLTSSCLNAESRKSIINAIDTRFSCNAHKMVYLPQPSLYLTVENYIFQMPDFSDVNTF